jgi:(1->4)-alpha-D-glucan 1-alpha-D-glucosylmutase
MSDEAKLAELGTLAGIHRDYWDIWGQRHVMEAKTERVFLEAIGFDSSNDEVVDSAITQLSTEHWQPGMAPVLFATREEPVSVTVCLPADLGPETLNWTLTAEGERTAPVQVHPHHRQHLEDATVGGRNLSRWTLTFEPLADCGYHHLELAGPALISQRTKLIVTPQRCFHPEWSDAQRVFGVSVQLYSLRSQRNWGIGDFSDLRAAAAVLGSLKADFIGINPLHTLYQHAPERFSPYSPSSRTFLNPLYLAVDRLSDFTDSAAGQSMLASPEFKAELSGLRDSPLIDYPGVARIKNAAFDIALAYFKEFHLVRETSEAESFRAFQVAGGRPLQRLALYEALQATTDQPSPLATDEQGLLDTHADAVLRCQYLQWLCEEQLREASAACHEAGMNVGLYCDLAVGSDSQGADVWSEPALYAKGVNSGAPPDDLALQGQAWGLSPWIPRALRHASFEPFIRCVRANMRRAGALRIDHVVGLMRQFWVPNELGAAAGGYMESPFQELLAILALESERNQCMVIGEDLGTIPDALRTALTDYQILSYKVLYFEKDWDGDQKFLSPADYSATALVTVSTHDLPTLAGYCLGHDLNIRSRLALFPSDEFKTQQFETRREDLNRLNVALSEAGLLPGEELLSYGCAPSDAIVCAIHEWLARAPSKIMCTQIEDLLGEEAQANVPGTTDEAPNWRRKLSVDLEQWPSMQRVLNMAAAMARGRQTDL